MGFRRVAMVTVLAGIGLAGPARGMDLLQAYQSALDKDASFAASRAAAEASQEVLPQAKAQLLPNVSASGSRMKSDLVSTTPSFFGGSSSTHTEYISSDYTFSVRQPLYRKYQWAAYQQAKAQVEAANAGLDKDRQELGLRVSSTYVEALYASDALAMLQAQKAAYGAQLASAKKGFQVGVGTRTDIDEALARYDMITAQEMEARANVETTRNALEAVVGQPIRSLSLLVPERIALTPPTPAKLEDWIARGEANSPELINLKAQEEGARQEVEKARAGHLPTVDLVAQRNRSQSSTVTSVNSLYLSTQVGVQVSIPIFAGGQVSSAVRQATANLEKVRQLYEGARRNLGVQVKKEFDGVVQGVTKVRALEQALRSAEQAVYSTQKGIQAGTRTGIDLLNAQQQRLNAQRELSQGRFMYLLSNVRLLALAGALGEEEIKGFNRWFANSP